MPTTATSTRRRCKNSSAAKAAAPPVITTLITVLVTLSDERDSAWSPLVLRTPIARSVIRRHPPQLSVGSSWRRPDDMMPGTCLDSTETTPALDISQAEQLRSGLQGGRFRTAKSALAGRNVSFVVRSCSPHRASGAAGLIGVTPARCPASADPIHRFLRCPGGKLGDHRFVKMSITLALQ